MHVLGVITVNMEAVLREGLGILSISALGDVNDLGIGLFHFLFSPFEYLNLRSFLLYICIATKIVNQLTR